LAVGTVVGDLRDIDSLIAPLAGIDELYHVAADYRLWSRDPRELYESNVEGTRNILEAALGQGVPRIVYTSTVGCLGIPKDGTPGDENTPVTRDELVGHYKKSKFDAEQVALQYAAEGLGVVIVNPSTPVGPGDIKPTPTGKMIVDFLRGKMPAYVDTGLNLIAVEDVAQGHLLAAERGTVGEKYILGNQNLTLREIFAILARITGRKPPAMRVPHWLALAAAVCDSAVSRLRNAEPSIPIEAVLMSRKRMFFSEAKAVSELGLPQSSVEDALARAVQWFQDNQSQL
jgi:dihydroflavonol-4-reductase